jgi:thiosulfate dehydrogenase
MKASVVVGLLIFVVLAVVGGALSVSFIPFLDASEVAADMAVAQPIAAPGAQARAQYFPPRPEDAPENIRSQVLRGRDLLMDTRHLLPNHAGNSLVCGNCHFSAGRNEGGKNDGFSLVGVAVRPPAGQAAAELPVRIAACFRRNLNATPPAPDSPDMQALAIYLRWISAGVPLFATIPWLAPAPLTSTTPADLADGQRTVRETCGPCHGDRGQGTHIAPATIGPESFSAQSQMLAPGILEQFIHDNMPRANPNLTPAVAMAAAAYLRSQPRPRAP